MKRLLVVVAALIGLFGTVVALTPADAQSGLRLRGRGSVADNSEESNRFIAELPCSVDESGAMLDVRFGDNRFSLDEMEEADCDVRRRSATHDGSGLGRCNDEREVFIAWRFRDGGSGGRPDRARIEIEGEDCEFSVGGPVSGDVRMVAR